MNFIRLITTVFFSVLFFNNSFALDCNRTVSAAVTVQYNCGNSSLFDIRKENR